MSKQHAHHFSPALGKVFYWAIGLNLAYTVIEAIFGFATDSMGLLSDAGHNLSDVASLLIALLAYKAALRPASARFTYGLGRATIEASLINAVMLYIAVVFIVIESIERLQSPVVVNGDVVAWVAGIGVIINGVTTWMLMKHSRGDLNVKGAFLHMAADTLVSVGVVISGIVIRFTGWYQLDPIIGLVVAAIIAVSSYSLLRESLNLSFDAVPKDIDIHKIENIIDATPLVVSYHHLHIWPLSTTQVALTVHVVVDSPSDVDRTIDSLRARLSSAGIAHSTIEVETKNKVCKEEYHDRITHDKASE